MNEQRAYLKDINALRALYEELGERERFLQCAPGMKNEFEVSNAYFYSRRCVNSFFDEIGEAFSAPMGLFDFAFNRLCTMESELNKTFYVSERIIGRQS